MTADDTDKNVDRATSAALHARAAAITAADLRYASEPQRHTNRRAPLVAALAAAAVVPALAVGIAAWRTPSTQPGPGSSQSAATGPRAAIGIRWRLITVRDANDSVDVSALKDAGITFEINHNYDLNELTFGANDSINYLSGPCSVTADGFAIGDWASSGVGYVGHDPAVLAAMHGLVAILSPHLVATVSAGQLILSVLGWRLTFTDAGPAPVRPTLRPSTAAVARTGTSTRSYVNGSELAPPPSTTTR